MLWERYRAWWGAHDLNEKDPGLLDRMKAEEKKEREKAMQEKLAKMSELKRVTAEAKKRRREEKAQKAIQGEELKMAREEAELKRTEKQEEKQEANDTRLLAEHQNLAVAQGTELNSLK